MHRSALSLYIKTKVLSRFGQKLKKNGTDYPMEIDINMVSWLIGIHCWEYKNVRLNDNTFKNGGM